jgi:hypothetical protein
MKKLIAFIIFIGLMIFINCEINQPDAPVLNIPPNTLAISKIIAIGASYTAGYQSGGVVVDFQKKNYAYLILQQMGRTDEMQMGWLAQPGFGSADPTTGTARGPMKWENGSIVEGDPVPGGIPGIPGLLLNGGNAELRRPYDNVGVPGAKLNDLLNTFLSTANPYYALFLRNPNFANTTEVDQAILLQSTMVLMLLPGGNDYLGAATSGTAIMEPDAGFTLTSPQNHLSRLTQVIERIQSSTRARIMMSNLPYPKLLPYINLLDPLIYIDVPVPGVGMVTVPVVFDDQFQPVNFSPDPNNPIYLPLVTEEGIVGGQTSPIKHILLPFLSQYQATGLGVPDSAIIANTLIGLGFDQVTAAVLAQQAVQGLVDAGLTPSGVPIPGNLTLTEAEEQIIDDAVDQYNANILSVAQSKGVPFVDLVTPINQVIQNPGSFGVTALFVFFDPNTTMFSLDGVHPNDAGQVLIANEFIKKINSTFSLQIPNINPGNYTGQYSGSRISRIAPGAIEKAVSVFKTQN